MRWGIWLRHCASSRKVTVPIHGGVIILDIILPAAHYGPAVDSASNRNEYQEHFLGRGDKGGRCLGLTTLPTSFANCQEIW